MSEVRLKAKIPHTVPSFFKKRIQDFSLSAAGVSGATRIKLEIDKKKVIILWESQSNFTRIFAEIN